MSLPSRVMKGCGATDTLSRMSPLGPPPRPAPPRPLTRTCWPSFTPAGILTSICSPFCSTTRRVPPIGGFVEADGDGGGEILALGGARAPAPRRPPPSRSAKMSSESPARCRRGASSQLKWKSRAAAWTAAAAAERIALAKAALRADRSRADCRRRRSRRHRTWRACPCRRGCHRRRRFPGSASCAAASPGMGVGMMLLGQRPERLLDLGLARRLGHAEDFVRVFHAGLSGRWLKMQIRP